MTGQELFETVAWLSNRTRLAEELIQQLTQQAQALANRARELEVENSALKARLEPKAPPAEALS